MADDPWAQFVPQSAPVASPAGGPAPAADPWAQFVPKTAAPTDPAAATRAAYNAQPWYKQIPQALDDTVRNVVNGATFGYADKLAAAGNSALGLSDPATALATERAASQAAMDRAGGAGTADSILGMLAPAGAIGKGVAAIGDAAKTLPLVGRVLGAAIPQAAATGATVGGLDAAGHDQPVAPGAIIGAGAGAAGQVAANAGTGLVSKIAGLFSPAVAVPTGDALKTAAQNAYAASGNAGIVVNAPAAQNLVDTIQKTMADFGYSPYTQPGGQAVLAELGRFPTPTPAPGSALAPAGATVPLGPMPTGATLQGLDTLRQVAGRMRENGPSSAALGAKIVANIDAFTNSLQPSDILAGDAPGGVAALNNARDLWKMSAKSAAVDDAKCAAELSAASSGSGGGINNATRQQAKALLNRNRPWTPDERAALTDISMGSTTANALRLLGKLSPTNNGLMSALNLGGVATSALAGGPVGAAGALAVPAVGYAAKSAADAITTGKMTALGDLVRSGGDASALTAAPNAVQSAADAANGPLSSVFLNSGINASLGRAPPELARRHAREGSDDSAARAASRGRRVSVRAVISADCASRSRCGGPVRLVRTRRAPLFASRP